MPFLAQATADDQALAIAIGLAIVGLILLVPLRLMMKRRRLLLDTPTSQTAGVTIGLTELKGCAEEMQPLQSFLNEAAVVHYAYEVEEHWRRIVTETYTDDKGNSRTRTKVESGWTTVDSGGAQVPFWLRDDSGRIRILPDGAKMDARCILNCTCTPGDSLYYGKGPAYAVMDSTHTRRFTEHAMCLGDPLYVMGAVRACQEMAEPEVAADKHADMFLISTRSEAQIVSGYGWLIALWGILGFLCASCSPLSFELCRGADIGPAITRQIGWMVLGFALYTVLVLCLYAAGLYNGLIRLRERVRRAWAMVEVELQRRADLIPNLAEAVKAYAAHEQGVQQAMAQLRANHFTPAHGAPTDAQVAAGMQTAQMQAAAHHQLLAIAENYPKLKASDLYQKLTANLVDTENRLALGRSFFNASVELHNARLLRVPDNLFTRIGGFAPVAYYEVEEVKRGGVRVGF